MGTIFNSTGDSFKDQASPKGRGTLGRHASLARVEKIPELREDPSQQTYKVQAKQGSAQRLALVEGSGLSRSGNGESLNRIESLADQNKSR